MQLKILAASYNRHIVIVMSITITINKISTLWGNCSNRICSQGEVCIAIYSHGTGRGRGRDGTGRDGTGRDGTGRDGTGRAGTGRDGTGRDGTGRDRMGRDGGTGRDGMGRGRDGDGTGTGRDETGYERTERDINAIKNFSRELQSAYRNRDEYNDNN